ncbi:hypothetical protein VaNZ11_016317, partial [Volvox africanus]
HLTRTQVLWSLGQEALARQTLAECSSMARDLRNARPDLSCVLTGWLAQTLLGHAVDVATGRRGNGALGGTAAASDQGLGFALQARRLGGGGGGGGGVTFRPSQ